MTAGLNYDRPVTASSYAHYLALIKDVQMTGASDP